MVNDRLFVIGGQEGDFMAKPGSPIFKCSRRKEVCRLDHFVLIRTYWILASCALSLSLLAVYDIGFRLCNVSGSLWRRLYAR